MEIRVADYHLPWEKFMGRDVLKLRHWAWHLQRKETLLGKYIVVRVLGVTIAIRK